MWLAGCEGQQTPLDPKGPHAATILNLFWWFVIVCAIVWILVVVFTAFALRGNGPRPDPLADSAASKRSLTIVVGIFTALTGLTIMGLTALSYAGQRQLYATASDDFVVKIVGRRWWWRIQYESSDPSQSFETANELHVPVGKRVRLKLESDDVIHSFWVPNLAGKQDLVPGRQNFAEIEAQRPGVYRGQCAEFCGWQHAHMGFTVVAEAPDDFDHWRKAQIAARVEPDGDEARMGEAAFLRNACVSCHTVRGTGAASRIGPDLTHLGSRKTIASGTLPTTRGAIAAWIADPQSIKPGSEMPQVPLSADDLNALVTYLEGLK